MTNNFLGWVGMKIIKKFISVFLSATIAVSIFVMNANALSMGNIGVNETNIVWSLDDEGNLTISGTGEMKSLNNNYTFDGESNKIKTVIIEDGIINIGSYIFSLCENMSSISIPVSVTEIGKYAFAEASALKNIYYEGTKAQWKEIRIETEGNTYFSNAKINFKEEPHICSYETVVNTLEPTCVTDGSVTKVCSCGNKNTTPIPATGVHNFGEWKTTINETEDHNGEEERTCKICKYARIIDNIKSDDEILVGDVNEDGNITAVDARIILQIVAGLKSVDSINTEIADVSKDEKITAVDARYILQIVAGLK